MVRQFHIRDVSVVQRLSPLGRSLAFEATAVEGVNPLREAMRAYMSPGPDDEVTLVRRGDAGAPDAFCLMHLISGQDRDGRAPSCAALMYMAPDPNSDGHAEAWMELIDESARVAAERGASVIVAEAPENSGEAVALQGAGFTPVIHVDILKLATVPATLETGRAPGVREQVAKDDRDDAYVKWLTQRVVPKPIQRPETSGDLTRVLHQSEWGFLLMRDNEALGYVSVSNGRRAYGVQVLFRQEAEPLAAGTLEHALAARCRRHIKPVYASVPMYQAWLLPAFGRLGFVHIASTVLMVRHVTALIRQPVWSRQLAVSANNKFAKSGDRVRMKD